MSLPPSQPKFPPPRFPWDRVPRWAQVALLMALIAGALTLALPPASQVLDHYAGNPTQIIPPQPDIEPAPVARPEAGSPASGRADFATTPEFMPQATPASPQTLVSREFVATEWLSVGLGNQPADRPIAGVALAAGGDIVAFATRAGNVAGQAVNIPDGAAAESALTAYEQIYVLDRTVGALELITLGSDGLPGNGWSSTPALSPDGRFVAFYSWAGNLVAGDTNAVQDAFVYDRQRGEMSRVSVSSTGRQGNDRSGDSRPGVRPALSADGRWIAFHSAATNLVDAPVSGVQVFLHDRQSGETELLSGDAEGRGGNGDSQQPALSADGNIVVLQSRATNLAGTAPPDLTAGNQTHWQVWLFDRTVQEWTLVSRAAGSPVADSPAEDSAAFANGDSTWPALSSNGEWIAFQSTATNLAITPPIPNLNQAEDTFVYHRPIEELRRVSISSMGIPGNRDSGAPAVAADGRYVAFVSAATNLVSGDTNDVTDVFVHDLQTRHTSRVSVGVVGEWTGVQADGPAAGLPALSADGAAIAFVAQAPGLLPARVRDAAAITRELPAQLYVHTRRPPQDFAVTGRIVDIHGQPIAQAAVRAGPHRTETDAGGHFSFAHLVGGTYTLVAEHSRYSFSPPRRILSVLGSIPGADFTGYASMDPGQAFLDLPFAYDGSVTTFLQALRDTSEGGLVDAWFDHAYPDYRKTGSMLLWDGRLRDVELYNEELGCYQSRCYDGHDGVDFTYRAALVDAALGASSIPIVPAAPGRVVHLVTGCAQTDRECNRGYGNEVILYHDNGYFTRYSHLAQVDVTVQTFVTRATRLGIMGSTGNSYGIHLHFAVHRDNGNGQWDGDSVDRSLDPFGWAGSRPDPWVAERGGPVSRWLWLHHPTAEGTIVGSVGGTLRDAAGNIEITIAADAFQGQARFELAPAAPEGPLPSQVRSVGRAFWVRMLDLLDAGAPQTPETWTPAAPLQVEVSLEELDLRHLDMNGMAIRRWDAFRHTWQVLPTEWDAENLVARAETHQLGNFDVQAPVLCPQDRWEPDDMYFAAVPLEASGAPIRRLLDVPADEDWFRVETGANRPYLATVDGLGAGVLVELTLFDADGITELERIAADMPLEAMSLGWTTDASHVVFLRVRPHPQSVTGCDATYSLRVDARQ